MRSDSFCLRGPYGCALQEDVGIFRMLIYKELFAGFDVAVMLASVQPEEGKFRK